MPHPLDSSRHVFLSYDQCHILKNLRNALLDVKRELSNCGKPVTGWFVRRLYELQREKNLKLVRRLTHKHVYPTNFEKMHVGRAVDIFSTDKISALEFLKEHGPEFGISEFKNAEGTIEFLKMVNKWFTILNVKNTHQYVHKRNDDAMHFFSVDDARLFWLENDFIPYLEWWEKSVTRKAEFISSETFEAACLTTKSAVECIKYLLQNGFHFVLTRKFSSDEIESLFSCIRQLAGSNDQTNAASVTQALHKILVTGLVSSSFSGNVRPDSACSSWMPSTRKSVNEEIQDVCVPVLNSQMLAQLKYMEEEPTELPSVSMTTAAAAYIGGYLVRVVEENIQCDDCVNRVSSAQSPSPIMALIKGKDRGGLRYPKPIFVMLLTRLERVVDEALKSMIGQPRILRTLSDMLLPYMSRNPVLQCGKDVHSEILSKLILQKFLRPYITNFTNNLTDQFRRDYVAKRKENSEKKLSRKSVKTIPIN